MIVVKPVLLRLSRTEKWLKIPVWRELHWTGPSGGYGVVERSVYDPQVYLYRWVAPFRLNRHDRDLPTMEEV